MRDSDTAKTQSSIITLDRRQSKTLLTIDELRSKIARNSVFNCHLSPVWRQTGDNGKLLLINFLSTLVDSIKWNNCRLSGVNLISLHCAHEESIMVSDEVGTEHPQGGFFFQNFPKFPNFSNS